MTSEPGTVLAARVGLVKTRITGQNIRLVYVDDYFVDFDRNNVAKIFAFFLATLVILRQKLSSVATLQTITHYNWFLVCLTMVVGKMTGHMSCTTIARNRGFCRGWFLPRFWSSFYNGWSYQSRYNAQPYQSGF